MNSPRIRRLLGSPWAIAAVVVLLMAALAPPLSFVEVRALDLLLKLVPPTGLDKRIEVIDLGDKPEVYEDLRVCAPAPDGCEIPRAVYAEAVRRLHRWGAKVIVFDLMFSRRCEAEDTDLAAAFREAGNVIVAATTKVKPGSQSLKEPVAPLDKACTAGSPVTHMPNQDVRMVPLVVPDDETGDEFRALSLLAFARFAGVEPSEITVADDGDLLVGEHRVPVVRGERISLLHSLTAGAGRKQASAAVDVEGGSVQVADLTSWHALIINWSGPEGTIHPHAMRTVLDFTDEQGSDLFAGKVVIIGRRSWDEHWTAVGSMAGPDIQANVLHTLISGRAIRPLSTWVLLPLLYLFAVTTSFVARRTKAVRATLAVGLLAVVIFAASQVLLARAQIWAFSFMWFLTVAVAWAATSTAQSDRVANMLRRFVPAFLEVREPGIAAVHEVRTRDATVLFTDIRNYTTISEQLEAATMLRLISAYRAELEDIVGKYGGDIAVTPGDAVLAVFWKDHNGANHPTCAVRAGREMLDSIPRLAEAWQAAGSELAVGVGINAGPVAMGYVGRQRVEATIMGDAVNVSQRLESLTKELGKPLIMSETVQSRLSEEIETAFIDEVTVKGRQEPIKLYGLTSLDAQS